MFLEILKYGFLVIFFSTAVMGLVSIPGWLKIPDWYRKKIFIALILEVVGVIVILFNKEVVEQQTITETPSVTISDQNWWAFNKNGQLIQPSLLVETSDTTIEKKLGNQEFYKIQNLSAVLNEQQLEILNADSLALAHIRLSKLKSSGLFNGFKTANGEITSTENYAYVKWKKSASSSWKQHGQFLEGFSLNIQDFDEGTYYQVVNNFNQQVVFDSRNSSKNLFAVDNRIIHFYQYNHRFYLLRISWADLNATDKYVHVINVKMEPTLH